jgi:hypothetical protein
MDIFSINGIIWGNVMIKCFAVKKIYAFDIYLFLSDLYICIVVLQPSAVASEPFITGHERGSIDYSE